jgi:hypothetical protein
LKQAQASKSFSKWDPSIQLKYRELCVTEGTVPIMVTKNKYPFQGSNTYIWASKSLFPDQIVDLLDEAQLFVHSKKLQGSTKLKHFNIKLQKLERECKNQTLLQIIRVIQLNAGILNQNQILVITSLNWVPDAQSKSSIKRENNTQA